MPDPGKRCFFHFARVTQRKSTQVSAFFRLTRSCSHCYKHFRAANIISSGAPLFTAPPTSFPAALHFSPHRQRHSQRRSTFHRAANIISSGAPLSTAPPTSFPAALHFPPRRQHLFQRCSASYRAANVISNGAPLCTAPLRYYTIAHHQKKRRENPSLSCVRNTLKTVISSESVSPSASGNFDVFLALC